jgi:tetrahydromethanopterin S-methyltransferase subunit C
VLTGMRRGVVTRGLFDFEVAALVGAITGSIVGAVVGLVAGQLWETRHRKNRIARQVSHG